MSCSFTLSCKPHIPALSLSFANHIFLLFHSLSCQ
jgi:hypothetical protein